MAKDRANDPRNDAGYWYSKTGMTPDDVQEEDSKSHSEPK